MYALHPHFRSTFKYPPEIPKISGLQGVDPVSQEYQKHHQDDSVPVFVFGNQLEHVPIADAYHRSGMYPDSPQVSAPHTRHHGKRVEKQAVNVQFLRLVHSLPVTGGEKEHNRDKTDCNTSGVDCTRHIRVSPVNQSSFVQLNQVYDDFIG